MQNDTFQLPDQKNEAPKSANISQAEVDQRLASIAANEQAGSVGNYSSEQTETIHDYSGERLGRLGLDDALRQIDENDRNKEWLESANVRRNRVIDIGGKLEEVRTSTEKESNIAAPATKSNGLLKNLFNRSKDSDEPVKPGTETRRELLQREAVIGGRLFGPIPNGNVRQFFCLDKHCWVWHEEWNDQKSGQRQSLTTRYEIRNTGILKAQGDQAYHFVESEEEKNLTEATGLYYQQVMEKVYGRSVTI